MGLSLYFSKKPRDLPDIAQFHGFWALFRWVEKHVIMEPMGPNDHIVLEPEHLEQLLDTLNRLTPNNCAELFPENGGTHKEYHDTDSDYWVEVSHLKNVIFSLLETFDFKDHCVELTAWW
ncbi:hypothetical protein [Saezia sanguinis]|uniref:hypothetical protein n=1 Tax=Saezia sanguinis TaxID=1965230 RepID=UPI00305B3794